MSALDRRAILGGLGAVGLVAAVGGGLRWSTREGDEDPAGSPAQRAFSVVRWTEAVDHWILIMAARTAPLLGEDPAPVLERLWTQRFADGDHVGWGRPFAWDVWNDGTDTPEGTILAAPTMAAGLAFLEAGDQERATAAARTCRDLLWNGSHFWKSTNPNDHRPNYGTWNEQALGGGLLVATGYTDVGQRALGDVVAQQGVPGSPWNWWYSRREDQLSDSFHYALTLEGLAWGDVDLGDLAGDGFDELWRRFYTDDGEPLVHVDSPGSSPGNHNGYSLYGLTRSRTGQADRDRAYRWLAATLDGSGWSSMAQDAPEPWLNREVDQSFAAFGLAAYEAAVSPTGSNGRPSASNPTRDD